MLALYIILSLLFVLESSTSISRKAGYNINNPTTGFVFQSSISLVSRVLVFMFMPLLGYLSDQNNLYIDYYFLLYYSFIVILLYILYFYRNYVEKIYSVLLFRMDIHGTFFKPLKKNELLGLKFNKLPKFRYYKKFTKFYTVYLISYIPYYLAWPIIIFLLQEFNDNRGMILGLSAIFNGINTLIITLIIDPKLAQLGKYNKLIQHIYSDLILLRVYSSIFGYLLLVFFIMTY